MSPNDTVTPTVFLPTPEFLPSLAADYSLGVVLLLVSLLGVSANIASLPFFTAQRRDLSNMVYIAIVTVDIVNCALMFPPALCYLWSRRPVIFSSGFMCNLWGVVFQVTSRLSVFLVATLSISRTWCLVFPFRRIRRMQILLPMIVYTVLMLGVGLLPFYYGQTYEYLPPTGLPVWKGFGRFPPAVFLSIYVLCIQAPLFLPFLPIVASCVVSTYKLLRPTKICRNKGAEKEKRYASTTIIIVTLIYIGLNFPVCIYVMLEVTQTILTFCFEGISIEIMNNHDLTSAYVRLTLAVYCVGFNAAVNPAVYLWRFRAFRRYSSSVKKRIGQSFSYRRCNKDIRDMHVIPHALSMITEIVYDGSVSTEQTSFGTRSGGTGVVLSSNSQNMSTQLSQL